MKKFYHILFAILLFPFLSHAQVNYKPGYVVTLKGDTIRGFIDYRQWDSNPDEINFKTTITDTKAHQFTPAKISFFFIDGLAAYQRYAGMISTDATDVGHISNGRDNSFRIDTVFLKVLQRGKNVSLYSYSDALKQRFYIAEKSDALVELGYHLYTLNEGAQSHTVVDNGYMKQLFALAQKYGVLTDDLENEIQRASYKDYDILPITSTINQISKAEYKAKYSKNIESKIRLFVSLGLNVTTLSPTDRYKTAGGKTETSYFPVISFGGDLFANRYNGKLLFRLEGIFTANQYKSLTIFTNSPYVPVRYSYDQTCLSLTPQVIYNFYIKDNSAAYIGLGLALTFYQYSNATYDLNYADTQVKGAHLYTSGFFHTFGVPVIFKAGVKFSKNWGVFANYLPQTAVNVDVPLTLNASSIQAGMNYFFN